jgi:hypothetical protein
MKGGWNRNMSSGHVGGSHSLSLLEIKFSLEATGMVKERGKTNSFTLTATPFYLPPCPLLSSLQDSLVYLEENRSDSGTGNPCLQD